MQLQFMEIMPIPPKSQRYSCHHMAITLFQSLVMATTYFVAFPTSFLALKRDGTLIWGWF